MASGEGEFQIFGGEIQSSATDDRSYRYLTLKNELRCLLVSDPQTEKSSACCAVNVGSLCDPPDAQGLAHFLEHMLFMGTEKYPVENAYSAFLNSHGGFSNAYTSQEETVYYFDVQPDAMEEALDLFSSFFTCPLFTESATQREINAVDSENTKNLQADNWRQFQLFKSLAREGHPLNSFSTGNIETLGKAPAASGKNIRDMMIDFYNQYYSANLMRVVVYGKEPLDQLQQWAVEKFSQVPNKQLQSAAFPADPFPDSAVRRRLEVVPIRDTKKLSILFPIPAIKHLYRTKPTRFLAHMIGHESAGSILSALKQRMWANGLSAGPYSDCRDFACFAVNIDLTDDGTEHTDDIIACVFAYIGMLQQSMQTSSDNNSDSSNNNSNNNNTCDWAWQEMHDVEEMNFRFLNKSEPSSYTVRVANSMLLYPPELCLSGDYLMLQKNLAQSLEYLQLMTPDNCIAVIKHQGFAGKTSLKEKWYGTDYNDAQFSEQQLAQWKRCREQHSNSEWAQLVFLPQQNPFISTDFALRTAPADFDEAAARAPKLIENDIQSDAVLDCMIETDAEDTAETVDATTAAAAEAATTTTTTTTTTEAATAAVEEEEEGDEDTDEEEDSGAAGDAKLPVPAGTRLRTWHLQDAQWRVPKLNVKIALETQAAGCSPLNIAFAEVFCGCLKENLSEYSYYADCAGLYYDVQLSKSGVDIALQGYHSKLPVLAEKIAAEIRRISGKSSNSTTAPIDAASAEATTTASTTATVAEVAISAPLFERMKEMALRSLKNYLFSQPYFHCILGSLLCLEDPRFSNAEKYNALQAASYEDFLSYCRVQRFSAAVLVHGNITAAESTALTAMISQQLPLESLPHAQVPLRRVVQLAAGAEYVYRTHAAVNNPAEVNSAVENIYMLGVSAGAGRLPAITTTDATAGSAIAAELSDNAVTMEAMLELLAHMMSEPAFDQLRTKEQLGYIVFTGIKRLNQQVLALHVIVQSSHKDPQYLDARIESFLLQFRAQLLNETTAEQLLTNVQTVIDKLLEKPKNIDQESDRYWSEIKSGMYWFQRRASLAAVLQRGLTAGDITTAALVQFLDSFAAPTCPDRRKLSSQFYGKGTRYRKPTNAAAIVISDPGVFRQSMPLQPVPDFDPTAC